MLGTILHGARDVRCEEVQPKILKPTDAIIRLSASCICGSDLWPFRGLNDIKAPMAMGHEYCGIVEEVGSAVKTVHPGQFVVGSFCLSDNTCPHCRFGFQSSCEQREFMTGAQAPLARVPLADGTLVSTAEVPDDGLIPSLLATSDVFGTGWYAADAARVQAGSTVRGCRRRRGRPDGRACGEADGGPADHHHEPQQDAAGPRIMLVPWTPPSPYRRREIVQGEGEQFAAVRLMRTQARVVLVDALRDAHRWLDELTTDPIRTIESIAAPEKKTERSIRMTLSLAFLSPALVKAAIDGRLPRGFGTKRLMDLPMTWSEQWSALGLKPPAQS